MKRSLTVLLGSVLALSACSDSDKSDALAPQGDRLERDEAVYLATEVVGSGQLTLQVPDEVSSDLAVGASGDFTVGVSPRTLKRDVAVSLQCPVSGRLLLEWSTEVTWDRETGDMTMDVEGRQEHQDCAFRRRGVVITVDGDPDIRTTAHAEMENHKPVGQHTLTVQGAFNWEKSNGASGRCEIDVQAITDWDAKTRTIEGTICGHEFRESLEWT